MLALAGSPSFGVAYGLYNVAWAIGLLIGPALGGFFYERFGLTRLSLTWAVVVIAIACVLAWVPRQAKPGDHD